MPGSRKLMPAVTYFFWQMETLTLATQGCHAMPLKCCGRGFWANQQRGLGLSADTSGAGSTEEVGRGAAYETGHLAAGPKYLDLEITSSPADLVSVMADKVR